MLRLSQQPRSSATVADAVPELAALRQAQGPMRSLSSVEMPLALRCFEGLPARLSRRDDIAGTLPRPCRRSGSALPHFKTWATQNCPHHSPLQCILVCRLFVSFGEVRRGPRTCGASTELTVADAVELAALRRSSATMADAVPELAVAEPVEASRGPASFNSR